MRSTGQFTDGRIHVTLWEGAYDLEGLEGVERAMYERLLGMWRRGAGLEVWESLWGARSFPMGLRLQVCVVLRALYQDFCRRVAMESVKVRGRLVEMVPWRPEESRECFGAVVGYVCPGEAMWERREIAA